MGAAPTVVNMLGTLVITRTGRELIIARSKERALTAFLVTNADRTFTRDSLSNLLWSNSTAEKARRSLSQAFYTINRAVPDLIKADKQTASIPSDRVTTDIGRLTECIAHRTLLRNLDLIRGEFLADLGSFDEPEFESWRSGYNREIFHQLAEAIEVELAAQRSGIRQSIRLSLKALPLHLFPALDVGTPATELQCEREEPALPEDHAGGVFSVPFVGRDDQLSQLTHLWRKAEAREPQCALIIGHPGHGKTRLVAEFIRSLPQGSASVLQARCHEAERRISFGPIIESLGNSVTAEDLKNIEPVWQAALQEIIPGLPTNSAELPPLSNIASQSRLFEAIVKTYIAVSKRTALILFIDDAQWLDKSTETLLSLLSRRLGNARVLVVMAARQNVRRPNPIESWEGWTRIWVNELTTDDLELALARLSKHVTNVPSITEIDRLTKGHPYLVSEVIRSHSQHRVGRTGPLSNGARSVDAVLSSLLSDLPAGAQRVAAGLAVIGRPVVAPLVGRIVRLHRVTEHLDLLVKEGLAYYSKGRVGLRHDLVRESTYRRIPLFTRCEFHRRTASELSKRTKRFGEIADHFYRGRQKYQAFRYAILAADQAEARHANEESIYFLKLAGRALPRKRRELRPRLAELLYRAHRIQDARAEVAKLLASAVLDTRDTSTWKVRSLELAYDMGSISGQELRARLYELRATLEADCPVVPDLLYLLTRSAFHDGDQLTAATATIELKEYGNHVQSPKAIDALAVGAHAHATCFSASEADEWASPLRERLESIGDHEQRVRVLVALTGVAYAAGRLVEATSLAETALRDIERVGAMNMWPINAAHTHMLYVEQGRFSDAITLYNAVRQRLASTFVDTAATVSANASLMLYEQGHFSEAIKEAEFGLSAAVHRQSIWTDLVLRGIHGMASLQVGDLATATRNAEFCDLRIQNLGTRMADLSYVEILIARMHALRGKTTEVLTRLELAIDDYRERDQVCRMRMQLEFARMLKKSDRHMAREIAKEVYENARNMNAVLIAEKADALLLRL